MEPLLNIHSWPQAIIHLDGDAFFASCEQATKPYLKGKPVITGKERGIISAASYEAKKMGITRAMRLSEAKKVCPSVIILPSDYETYSLFSKRMFDILRRYTSSVEEYSIDEAFADITGLRRPMHASYGQIAEKIKNEIETQLGITVSLGLSLSKVLAKIGSKFNKPSGLTLIPGKKIQEFLKQTEIDRVWGIGPNTTAYLNKLNIFTALDFAQKPFEYIKTIVTKPHQEIWQELNGQMVYPIQTELKSQYQSISKTRTFTPATADPKFVYAQLIRNLEGACLKARRHALVAQSLALFLKTQEFKIFGASVKLNRASAFPNEIAWVADNLFKQIFRSGNLYRATGATLFDLQSRAAVQRSLFESPLRFEKISQLYQSIDQANAKYGKSTVHLFSSQLARQTAQHQGQRGERAIRQSGLLKGENARQRIGLPLISDISLF